MAFRAQMVSVVCSNALNRAVKEFTLTDTGKILGKTRELVIETFEKSNAEIKDGMDVSLLCIDKQHQKISWSGANNPLWFVFDNQLTEITADKQPVGKSFETKPFTTNKIEYKKNTTFYLRTVLPISLADLRVKNSNTNNLSNCLFQSLTKPCSNNPKL